jgi:hypothetical protein
VEGGKLLVDLAHGLGGLWGGVGVSGNCGGYGEVSEQARGERSGSWLVARG